MAARVVLTLEYDMGDYSDYEEEVGEIPTSPDKWWESFFQSDVDLSKMKVTAVRVERGEKGDAEKTP